jgi:hypothetical protein
MKEAINSMFSKQIEEDLEDDIPDDERVTSFAIIVFSTLIVVYFVAHQMWSTGFFTTTFGSLEMFLLYGSLFYWILTSALMIFGYKNASRDLDSFGGLIFATIGIAWLYLVFPFDFSYFADILPNVLRFLVKWISDGIARGFMLLGIILHLIMAVYSGILRVLVRKARST